MSLVEVYLVIVYKLWDSHEVGSSVQFLIHASSSICICLVWRIGMTSCTFLMCTASVSERVLAEPFRKARVVVCITPAPFFVRSVCYSRAFSLCAASSICAPFVARSVFYSRAFSLCAAFSYPQAILKSSRSLFARLSLCLVFCFFGFAQWNIWIVFLYISLPLCMGESDNSFKKTLCLMTRTICPQDLLLSHEPTLWFRRHQLFGLGAPSF